MLPASGNVTMEPTMKPQMNLFITHVDKEGPFLKVWGQQEKNHSIYVEHFLMGASEQFEKGIGLLPSEFVRPGILVCAKYTDHKYYRAKVVSVEHLANQFVQVFFLDYGNRDLVPVANIRSCQNFPPTILGIVPLAREYILAEAHCTGGEWNDVILNAISKELKYREFNCVVHGPSVKHYLVKLYTTPNNEDVCHHLISKGLMQPVPLAAQQAVLLSMRNNPNPSPPAPVPVVVAPAPPPASTTGDIITYKAYHLEPGQHYAVYVSFVNDGPTYFSVQLQKYEQELAKLMKDINSINLRPLEDVPLPGTRCLARCQEDGNICRAVVTNEVDNLFKVFYVDFGNYETLPFESLYQISPKYVNTNVMATRLALNGIEKSSVTLDMLVAFKKFVDNRLLHMKVLPSPPVKKYVIPKCDLWDPETKITALEIIKRAALTSFPEPLQLTRAFKQPIKVSYVFSCNKFYVQLVSKEEGLIKLMQDLQISCQTADPVEPVDIKVGLPCCALFETDQQFYRAEIVDIVDKDTVKVKYIDFGNEEIIPIGLLRQIEGELMTVLRPQAIECCLTGYQNMPVDEERDGHWEELTLEQQFTMKVIEMLDKKALVELIDGNNYKAASLLLERLAAAKSQVSPLLVQDGNKIEHRKTSADFQKNDRDFRQDRGQDRKPRDGRDNRDGNRDSNRNTWGDRQPNERSGEKPWRQDNNRDRENFRAGNDRPNNRSNENNWNNRNGAGDSWGGGSPKTNENVAPGDTWSSPSQPPTTGDGWETTAQVTSTNESWGSKSADFKTPRDRENNFGARNKRFDNDRGNNDRGNRGGDRDRGDRGNWGDRGDRPQRDGFRDDGFKKRDFRGGSDSGSEKSFQKGPRTSSRNDQRGGGGGRFRDKQNTSFTSATVEDSWNVSAVTTPLDAAPSTAVFDQSVVVGTEAPVMISWFYDPTNFYLQLKSTQVAPEFRTLMEEIQEFYKGRKPETSVVGAPVVGLFPEDNVLYRAKVLEIFGGNYKVLYIDFGNIATVSKVWPIEKKFMTLPAQAMCCGLDGVAPNGESWPEATAFGKFFQKESYIARFLYENDSKTYVELWDAENSLASLLVQENLAIPLAAPQAASEVEITYLLGQQFRVILKSVNSLADIIVALECGLALNCKMHNLDFAEETFEDGLKGHLEQTLIVYVDNILTGDILEVTFYDNEGNKLIIVNPDEGALDIVEALCPILILGSQLSGFVAHADEKAIYVQPNQHADSIATLLEQMFEVYEAEVLETPIIPEEDMLYAVHSPDSNWYRGRCLSFDDNNVTVIYVDYGNTETVAFSELRELRPEFMVPHMLCVQVHLTSGTSTEYLEKDILATIYYGEAGWEGTCEITADNAAPFNSTEMQQDTLTEAVLEAEPQSQAANVAIPETAELIPETAEVVPEIAEMIPESVADQVMDRALTEDQPKSSRTPVYVSHVDTPCQFYVQFEASIPALDELQAYIQEAVKDWPVLEKVSVGVICAAPYLVDQQWYRAEVLDYGDDITTVRFVDFGNTDVYVNGTTELKTLPSNLLSLAFYATRCSLKLKPVEEEWSQAAIDIFETHANAQKVEAEFIIQDEKSNYVDLYADGKNVGELMTQENMGVPCEIVTESKSTCFISHLNSPSEFWVQMETCVDELEWIAEQLSGAESFAELEDTSPGTLCAALFPDDEMWYRARILSNTIAGIELLFIDYGNSCISSSLRQLPEDVLVTAPLAQKCCLQRPNGISYWTPEAQSKLIELSADGQTIFTMKKITTDETAVVELLLNEQNVVSLIMPLTEEGFVKNFATLSKFYVEKNGELSSNCYGLEPMPGMAWTEESEKKFKEQYPENTLFQLEIINENTLRLYINGADIRSSLGGEKISNVQIDNAQPDENITEQKDILDSKDIIKNNSTNTKLVEDAIAINSQICDTQISVTDKAVYNITEAVQDTNKVLVDSNGSVEEANITPDSGKYSEGSEEALIEERLEDLEIVEKNSSDALKGNSDKVALTEIEEHKSFNNESEQNFKKSSNGVVLTEKNEPQIVENVSNGPHTKESCDEIALADKEPASLQKDAHSTNLEELTTKSDSTSIESNITEIEVDISKSIDPLIKTEKEKSKNLDGATSTSNNKISTEIANNTNSIGNQDEATATVSLEDVVKNSNTETVSYTNISNQTIRTSNNENDPALPINQTIRTSNSENDPALPIIKKESETNANILEIIKMQNVDKDDFKLSDLTSELLDSILNDIIDTSQANKEIIKELTQNNAVENAELLKSTSGFATVDEKLNLSDDNIEFQDDKECDKIIPNSAMEYSNFFESCDLLNYTSLSEESLQFESDAIINEEGNSDQEMIKCETELNETSDSRVGFKSLATEFISDNSDKIQNLEGKVLDSNKIEINISETTLKELILPTSESKIAIKKTDFKDLDLEEPKLKISKSSADVELKKATSKTDKLRENGNDMLKVDIKVKNKKIQNFDFSKIDETLKEVRDNLASVDFELYENLRREFKEDLFEEVEKMLNLNLELKELDLTRTEVNKFDFPEFQIPVKILGANLSVEMSEDKNCSQKILEPDFQESKPLDSGLDDDVKLAQSGNSTNYNEMAYKNIEKISNVNGKDYFNKSETVDGMIVANINIAQNGEPAHKNNFAEIKEKLNDQAIEDVQNLMNNSAEHCNPTLLEGKHDNMFEKPLSRPSSRLSHDDRILPAVLSRPHSPIPLSPENESEFKWN